MPNAAGVYVLDAPYRIDRVYSYRIPAELAGAVVPGALVEVPFGNGNRHLTGIVYELSEAADTEDMKPVVSAAGVSSQNPNPLLDGDALRLCAFLKEHTLCTFGEAVRTVLPPAALSKISDSYSPADEIPDSVLEKMTPAEAAITEAVRERGSLTGSTLISRFGRGTGELLRSLVRRGVLKKTEELRESGSARYASSVYPAGELLSDLEEEDRKFPNLRSERQEMILSAILASPGVDMQTLETLTGLDRRTVRTAVDALEKKGYVRTERRLVYRNPFAGIKAEGQYSGDFTLSEEQAAACDTLLSLYREGAPRAALLHGVTGSGKTNVVLKLIDRAVEEERGVIMLVPEIALTPQTVSRFAARYGDRIAVIHSSLSAGERLDAWRRIKNGEATLVIGTRSAVFAPVKNLGLIVIDEEHEHTYKSDTDPKYLAHDVAAFRCGEAKALMILASATPSVVSYYKAMSGRYTLVELKNRYGAGKLPDVEISDMRAELASGNMSPLSRALITRIGSELNAGRQTILFLNRRGYNSFVSCRSCGEAVKCPHCSVTMTYHLNTGAKASAVAGAASGKATGGAGAGAGYLDVRRRSGYLSCHTCGHRMPVPEGCPECGSDHLLFMGAGTQLAEGELEKLFPGARVVRMDHDTTQGKQAHEALLSSFREGAADILLGTQMVTKGHDFPRVTTVGVLNADHSLFLGDFRANERIFSMLTQVIGRAGRADDRGVSVIQTFSPNSDVIALAAAQDYRTFYDREIRLRRALTFPPFCDIAVLTLSSSDEVLLAQSAARLGDRLREYISGEYADVQTAVFGPFEAPLYKIQNVCRLRYVIKCRLNRRTRALLSAVLCDFSGGGSSGSGKRASVRVTADLNPSEV